MSKRRLLPLLVLALMLAACGTPSPIAYPNPSTVGQNPTSAAPPVNCAVTRPPSPAFVPPPPAPAQPPSVYSGQVWYGTPDLWTMLPNDGTWSLTAGSGGLSQKVFLWSQAYNADAEPSPALSLAANRLDSAAAPILVSNATNARADFGQAMLVGLTLPSAGCWEVTGQYKGHNLSFVVWVTSQQP